MSGVDCKYRNFGNVCGVCGTSVRAQAHLFCTGRWQTILYVHFACGEFLLLICPIYGGGNFWLINKLGRVSESMHEHLN